MKNFALGILFSLLIACAVVIAYKAGQKENKISLSLSPTPYATDIPSPTRMLVGGDKDIHGCIGSAGYTWCAGKNKCVRPWEEPCPTAQPTQSDIEGITQALKEKNNWQNIELDVKITKNDGTYAYGSVNEKNAQAGGGYFYAIKENGSWHIVADGNGIITCEQVSPYPSFPTDLIPECYDSVTNTMKSR